MRQFEAMLVSWAIQIGFEPEPRLYEQAVDELWTRSNPRKTQTLRIRILFNKDLFKEVVDDKNR
jgi:hypothetical protein